MIGMGTPIQTLPISDAALREVDLLGVFRYANSYPHAIKMISEKNIHGVDFSQLATHSVEGFEQVTSAFELASKPEDKDRNLVMKVMIKFAS